MLRVLSLFSGIGGIDLGLEQTGGFRTVGFCEREPFPRAVLAKHWPGVPCWDDVRTLTGAEVERVAGAVDAVVGGFPCQPFSVAGKQQGVADERHLWPEMLRIVRELRPRWVLGENVPGLRTIAADLVCEGLEEAGYACWPLVVGADDVGAPHRRKRVWIVAHRDAAGQREQWFGGVRDDQRQRAVGDASLARLAIGLRDPGASRQADGAPARPEPAGAVGARWPARPGKPQHDWEEPRLLERGMGGAVDGLSERLVRLAARRAGRANREALKAYGNAVVPQVVAEIGRAILAAVRDGKN